MEYGVLSHYCTMAGATPTEESDVDSDTPTFNAKNRRLNSARCTVGPVLPQYVCCTGPIRVCEMPRGAMPRGAPMCGGVVSVAFLIVSYNVSATLLFVLLD